MKCELIEHLLTDYLKSSLDSSDRRLLNEHLGGCKSCRMKLESMQSLWTELEDLADDAPSPDLHHRFYRMLDAERKIPSEVATKPVADRVGWMTNFDPLGFGRPLWAAAYSCVLILGGMVLADSFDFMFGEIEQPETAQIQGELTDLRNLMALTLINQDSIQTRLQGLEFASQSDIGDPRLVNALLNAAVTDEASNVRLAALNVLLVHGGNPQIWDSIYESLLVERSPLLQLRMVEFLLDTAAPEQQNFLQQILTAGVLNSDIEAYLQNIDSENSTDTARGQAIDL